LLSINIDTPNGLAVSPAIAFCAKATNLQGDIHFLLMQCQLILAFVGAKISIEGNRYAKIDKKVKIGKGKML
jgi:ubiquinone biosynthesis protein COQ9